MLVNQKSRISIARQSGAQIEIYYLFYIKVCNVGKLGKLKEAGQEGVPVSNETLGSCGASYWPRRVADRSLPTYNHFAKYCWTGFTCYNTL